MAAAPFFTKWRTWFSERLMVDNFTWLFLKSIDRADRLPYNSTYAPAST